MFQNLTNGFVIVASGLFMGLIFTPVAGAGHCGGAIPCSCGDNVVAGRTLASSVDPIVGAVCGDNGLTIITSGVDLNLGGNKIVGSGDGTGILISVNGVIVRNGGVDNFQTGVGGTTNGSTIDAIRPNVNTGDGIFLQGNGNDLLDILAKRNGNNGVIVFGDGNLLEGHNDEYSGVHGIFVKGNFNQLIANKASENANEGPASGIRLEGNDNTLSKNRISKLNTTGIAIVGHRNTLDENQVRKQKGDGITISGDDNVLIDNISAANKGVGIIVTGEGNPAASQGNIVETNKKKPQCSIYGATTAPTCIVNSGPTT